MPKTLSLRLLEKFNLKDDFEKIMESLWRRIYQTCTSNNVAFKIFKCTFDLINVFTKYLSCLVGKKMSERKLKGAQLVNLHFGLLRWVKEKPGLFFGIVKFKLNMINKKYSY